MNKLKFVTIDLLLPENFLWWLFFQCTEADWDHLIEFIDSYCSFDEPVLDIFSMVNVKFPPISFILFHLLVPQIGKLTRNTYT